ncbi:MAG TPA: FkbM family methyltransferase [Xanthobacteraceae bacterium]|nr:FkbM family methyltransferase [Xanthobacteraceae bacterium]
MSYLALPYIRRELPGWGAIFRHCVGDYRCDEQWYGRKRTVVDKITGYELDLNLGSWSDRMTYFLGRWYDLGAQLVIREHIRPGDVVVDVGANRGMFALNAAHQVGPGGRVICFEPNPACASMFRHAVARNCISQIEIHQNGLSDSEENRDLFLPPGGDVLGTFAAYREEGERAVPCRLLVGDKALSGIAPNFIKIDVEGFEEHVIRGLQSTIREHHPTIYMECVERHLLRAGSSIAAMMALMESLGYSGKRVAYSGRHPTHCEYLPIDGRNCDTLWLYAA